MNNKRKASANITRDEAGSVSTHEEAAEAAEPLGQTCNGPFPLAGASTGAASRNAAAKEPPRDRREWGETREAGTKGTREETSSRIELSAAAASIQIVTSSWFAKLPPEYARIGISKGSPRGQRGFRRYGPLAPAFSLTLPLHEYLVRYDQQLAALDPKRVVSDIAALAEGKQMAALLCFEPAEPGPKWCHRGLVSQWLAETLGLDVHEWGREADGCGCRHPKLPPRS